jgi:hypothetical protein
VSSPAQHIGDAILLGSTGLKNWQKSNGCDATCDCAICWPLERGLASLNDALDEMKAVEE